ncbi:MAG: DUF1552 domain-containing protein [Myxococcales bacterium]|nr:MAG: DUF1552 domain-containing protein [Myxococcales bacterium]
MAARKNKTHISRRTLLRGLCGGAAIAVALPPLEAMFNVHGTAYGDGTSILRFGVWYFGGGVYQPNTSSINEFFPSTTGSNWTPRYQTEPLADPAIKDKVNILSRLSTTYSGDPGVSHNIHHTVALSGTGNPGNRLGQGVANAASIDQVIAEDFRARGYRSTYGEDFVGAQCSFGGHAGKSAFTANGNFISLHSDPRNLFDLLFAGCTTGASPVGNTPSMDERAQRQLLVVDAILQDAKALQKRVSINDQQRIEQHLQAIDALERRLRRDPNTDCSCPDRPTVSGSEIQNPIEINDGDEFGTGQSPRQAHRPMADLLALAIACDLTRVFNIEFIGTQTNAVLSDVSGVTESHHLGLTHTGSGKLSDTTRYVMEEYAYFLKQLAAIPEGAGTVLDNTAVFCTSESIYSGAHELGNHFAIVGGGAGGALKTGQFIDVNNQAKLSDIMYTLAKSVGSNVQGIGKQGDQGYGNTLFSPIWVGWCSDRTSSFVFVPLSPAIELTQKMQHQDDYRCTHEIQNKTGTNHCFHVEHTCTVSNGVRTCRNRQHKRTTCTDANGQHHWR